MKIKKLATQIALGVALITVPYSTPVQAGGIPVIDGVHITLNKVNEIVNLIEWVEQTITQIAQLEDMLMNSMSVEEYSWEDISGKMDEVKNIIDGIGEITKKLGTVDDIFGGNQVSDDYILKMEEESNASHRFVVEQGLKNLRNRAQQLKELEMSAQGAEGRMQSLQYSNQLLGSIASSLAAMHETILLEQQEKAREKQQETVTKAQIHKIIMEEYNTVSLREKSSRKKWSVDGVK